MSSTQKIEEQAARWIIRREQPDWSPADEAALLGWLEESMAHKSVYWRLEHGWRQADRISALGRTTVNDNRTRRQVLERMIPAAMAAGLATILVLSGGKYLGLEDSGSAPPVRLETPVGGQKIVPLADGSMIELNTATVVRSAFTQDRRHAWLDRGEAYFEIAHAPKRPFVVHAGRRSITVLGTKFSVRRDAEKLTVSVLEGKVQIDDAEGKRSSRSVTIVAGDIAIAEQSSTIVLAQSKERVQRELAWREGTLTFDQSTLAEAAAEFNRYNVRQIVIDDPEVANIRIGGTFQASNVDAFVRLLRDAYGINVEIERAP